MVSSMISLAHALDLKVIAEHVGSAHCLKWVADCGSDYGQGHYLGEPLNVEDIDFRLLRTPKPVAA